MLGISHCVNKGTEKAQPDRRQKNQEQLVSQIPQESVTETFLMKSSRMRREVFIDFIGLIKSLLNEQWEGKLDWKG